MRTLATLFARQYAPLRLRTRSDATRRLYGVTLSNFAHFLGRTPTLRDLSDSRLSAFADWQLSRGRSPATVNRDLANLLALWRWAAQRKMVSRWPEIQMLVEPQDEPQAWLRHELRSLWAAIRSVDGWIDGVRARDWWLALHCVLWDTGERIGAVLAARWHWVDFKNGWFSVPALARKGKRRGKVFRLHQDTINALRAIEHPPREVIFAWPWSYHYLWKRYTTDILIPAGLSHDRKSKFHRLRKTVASFAEAAGVDSSRLLGHSDRRVTQTYLDPRVCGGAGPATVLFRPDSV